MDKLSNGDQVVCKIKNFVVVSAYSSDYDNTVIFEIIGRKDNSYYVYVPIDMVLKDTIKVDEFNYKLYYIDKKFVDSTIFLLSDYQVCRIYQKSDGMKCEECGDFVDKAGANRADGTFICWSCKNYPQWKSIVNKS
jgi:hypothetical protein